MSSVVYSANRSAAAFATEAADAACVAEVTAEVRDLFAKSAAMSRSMSVAPTPPGARSHALNDCDGCDAAIGGAARLIKDRLLEAPEQR